jgi:hypothetical protein
VRAAAAVAAVLAGCGSGTQYERPVPRDLEPVREAFRLQYTEILRPEDFVLRTAEDVRDLERRAVHVPASLPLPPPGSVIVAAAAGQGRSGEPSISFAGFRARGDTVTVYVTLVRSIPAGRGCPLPDDVSAVVIGGLVPDAAQVRIERIEGRRPC